MGQKLEKNKDVWYQLDNAANIYPAVTTIKNTNVFRLSCQLHEAVDGALLQRAVDAAVKFYPEFQVIMRRGLFWHYLEGTKKTPQVRPETGRPCGRNYYISEKELLFSVTYFQRRINLEVFHAIADGGGALSLLRSIVYNYLSQSHREELPDPLPPLDASPPSHRHEDSFKRYYAPHQEKKKMPFRQQAYTIGGTALPYNAVGVIEASVKTGEILSLAKSKGVTVTTYIAALLIQSIYREHVPKRQVARRVGVTVPVDLRGHFQSETARNFFSVADVGYNFAQSPDDFECILRSVAEQLGEKLKPEALSSRINYTMGVQNNIFARLAPLFFKNIVLRAAYRKTERATSCAVSNMGRIRMPGPLLPHIDRFTCMLNPTPPQKIKICVSSFEDNFILCFTSNIAQTKVQKYFIRHLTEQGLTVHITCNGVYDDEVL